MTVDIKCSIISSSSSSLVWCCQIALQFAREKKQRTKEKNEKKKKNDGKLGPSCFSKSSLVGRLGADEVGLQASSAGIAKPVLAFQEG